MHAASSRLRSLLAAWSRAIRLRVALPLVLGGLLLFYLITLRPGFAGGGDAAQYILHAENIVEGQPYTATGYVKNPHAFVAPKAYPPGFPLLLAPLVALFGANLMVMKAALALVFVAALGVMAAAFRRALSPAALCALVAVVGLHPLFWAIKDSVLSDLPFLLLTFLALWAYDEAHQDRNEGRRHLGWALAAGVFACASIFTRSIGIVLLPCFVLHDVVRLRRLSRSLMVTMGACAALGGAAVLLQEPAPVGGGGMAGAGYAQLLHDQLGQAGSVLRHLPQRIGRVARSASMLWDTGYAPWGRKALFVFSLGPLLLGFGHRAWQKRSVFEVFALVYGIALLPWTFFWTRYLIPLIPLYFFYVFVGSARLGAWSGTAGRVVAGLGMLAIVGTYGVKYSTLDFESVPAEAATTPAATDFFAYVRQHTTPEDVLVAEISRQVVFFAERSAAPLHAETDEKALLRYYRRIGATYVVAGPPRTREGWWGESERLIRRYPARFEQVYANDEFQLYRVCYPAAFSRKKPAALAP